MCDLIIPLWNQLSYTQDCIESVLRHTPELSRLIVVDNGSTDGTSEYLRGIAASLGEKLVVISNPTNLGFVQAVNQGLKASTSPYVCLLNNDTLVTEGWLSRMTAAAVARPEIGLINPLGNVGGDWSEKRWLEVRSRLARDAGKFEEIEHCSGFCLLIKREVIDSIGFLDESFGMGNFEDNDYCERARRAGYLSVKVQDAWVHHFQNRSFARIPKWGENISEQNRKRLHAKWPPRPALVFIGMPAIPGSYESFVSLMRKAHAFARSRCRVAMVSGLPEPFRRETLWEDLGLVPHGNLKTYFLRSLPAGGFGNRFWFDLYALVRCRRLARRKGFHYFYLSGESRGLTRLRSYLPLPVLVECSNTRAGLGLCIAKLCPEDRLVVTEKLKARDSFPPLDSDPKTLLLGESVGDPARIWDPELEEFLSRLRHPNGSCVSP